MLVYPKVNRNVLHNVRLLLVIFIFICSTSFAQEQSAQDSVRRLEEVVVTAFAANRNANEVPAAIAVVSSKELNRFNNTSFLPALNTVPGVRMEERSPGSYRLSIRGSSLRSPFGVRNVKVYWNGLPFTDGGGNTYLNSLDFNSVTDIEVIKGPAGSLYGAGTGGVLLLNSKLRREPTLDFHFMAGSYGLMRYGATTSMPTKTGIIKLSLNNQKSKGYREHTAMARLNAQLEAIRAIGKKSTISMIALASNLDYETPGGLTKSQYESDPRQARPSTPTQKGAVDQDAAVNNETAYIGFTHEINWNEDWHTQTGIYSSITNFSNPSIRNYEKRFEGNTGGRIETQYKVKKSSWQGKLTFGGEFQHFYSEVEVYDNDRGVATSKIQLIDTLTSKQMLGFVQAEFDLPHYFFLTIGGSTNFLRFNFKRSAPTIVEQERIFDAQFSPRIALLRKVNSHLSIYSSASYGFSPPTFAEVRPSTGNFNNTLNPESGISYELGAKGLFLEQISFDVTAYRFQLKQTIVIQRTADNAEYFINAGGTLQNGLEAKISWSPISEKKKAEPLRVWASYSLNNYHFKNYVNDTQDFSGNVLTGISPHVAVAGLDFSTRGFYTNLTCSYADRISMNDSSSEFAKQYFLAGIRTGFKGKLVRPLDLFGGVDNLLDSKYSLGNDLNAIGGRYYNAAARRNYYIGLKIMLFISYF